MQIPHFPHVDERNLDHFITSLQLLGQPSQYGWKVGLVIKVPSSTLSGVHS